MSYDEARNLLEDSNWEALLGRDQVPQTMLQTAQSFLLLLYLISLLKLNPACIVCHSWQSKERLEECSKGGRKGESTLLLRTNIHKTLTATLERLWSRRKSVGHQHGIWVLFSTYIKLLTVYNFLNYRAHLIMLWQYSRCDRILCYGKGIEQLSYVRGESRFSDHRPVCAVFSVQAEMQSNRNKCRTGYSSVGVRVRLDDCIPQRHSFCEYWLFSSQCSRSILKVSILFPCVYCIFFLFSWEMWDETWIYIAGLTSQNKQLHWCPHWRCNSSVNSWLQL